MAEDDYGRTIPEGDNQSVGTIADFGKTLGAGAVNVGGNLAAASRYFFEAGGQKDGAQLAKGLQDLFGAGEGAISDTINPETKKLAASTLTSREFWEHPLLATALKTTGMLPAMAAMAIPGGLMADAVGATMAAAASGAAINASTGIDEFYKQIDGMSDKELQEQSPKYRAMREMMDEQTARARFNREAQGWAPAINAVIGAAAGAIGPAGTAARGLVGGGANAVAGAAERGALGSSLLGAGEGAVANAAQAGVSNITSQQTSIEAGFQKEMDLARAANATVEGGALGGIMGGAVGFVTGGGKAPAKPSVEAPAVETRVTPLKPIDASAPERVASNVSVSQNTEGRTGTANKPPEDADIGDKNNAPTRSPTDYGKQPKVKGKGKAAEAGLEVIQGGKPDAAQEAAIATVQPHTPATATEVAAQAEPTRSPTINKITEAQQAPPPQVAQAAPQAPPGNGAAPQPAPQGRLSSEVAARAPETPLQQQVARAKDRGTKAAPEALKQMQQPEAPRKGRVLPNLAQTGETTPLSDFNANRVEVKEPKGKNYSEEERAKVDEQLTKAKAIVEDHPPTEAEDTHLTNPEVRDQVIARARAMTARADAEGVKVQKQIKKSIKGNAPSDDPAIQVLIAAKALVKAAEKNKQGRAITEATGRFKQDEALVQGGHAEEMIARRREEGDQRMQRKPTDVAEQAVTEATPESILAAKEGVEVASRDEGPVTSEGKVDVEKNAVKTSIPGSAKGEVRGVFDEERKPSPGRVLSAEEKAAIAERMGLKPAKVKNDKVQPQGEALHINTSPSEAQKKAGNYQKIHRSIDGLELSVETPKGATRKGMDENGKPWEAKMPADYGYLRKTEGADGDHVDAYDGRNGDKHFIIDQLDHKTGAFDEHKVMLRFKSGEAAREAYEKSFSDGKGAERIGHIHEVSMDELKEWLHKGDTGEPHLDHVAGNLENELAEMFDKSNPLEEGLRTPSGQLIKPVHSDRLANELQRWNFDKMQGIGGILSKFFLNRFQKLANDTNAEIHFVTPEDMAKLFPGEQTPSGYHRIDKNGVSQIIVSTALKDNGIENGSLGHVVLHETAHAFTVREINKSPAAKATIRSLMNFAKKFMDEPANAEHFDIRNNYGFTNEKEFVAEAFSNRHFQELLAQIPMNHPGMSEYLGLNKNTMSMWDVFRGFVKKAIEKVTGKMPNFDSVLDGIMKVGEHLTEQHREEYIEPRLKQAGKTAQSHVQGEALHLVERGKDIMKELQDRASGEGPERAPMALKLRTFDNIAEIARHFFDKAKNPINTIYEAVQNMHVTAQKYFNGAGPLIKTLSQLRQKDPAQYREFASLQHDATIANLHPDVPLTDVKNAHLGKDVLSTVWKRAQHGELAERYEALTPEFKEAWHEAGKYYSETQDKMSLGIIKNQVLKLLGVQDDALANRIHTKSLTDADRNTLGSNADTIEKASELSKKEGYYVPLIRRGNHVVKGTYHLDKPANAKEISPNEFEFTTRKEAVDYAKASPYDAPIKKIWLDPKTGERLGAQELDAVDRYRVEVQNRHVEFIQGKRAAEARAAELVKGGGIDVDKVVPREFEPGGRQGAELSSALNNLVGKLEHSDAYKSASKTQQNALKQALVEASLASHGSTRVSSRAIMRRGVKGYSEDSLQNTADYASSSSRYLAKLDHMPAVEEGLKEAQAQIDRDHSKTGQYARQSIFNEVQRRVIGDNGFQQGGKFAPVIKRAMALSFMDKLGSPAYSVINAMQPGMVAMPYLGGRHGIGRSFSAMAKAYSDVSALKIIGQGAKETMRRIKGGGAPDDFITQAKKNLSKDEQRMVDEHLKIGSIDPSAGMEIAPLVRDTSGVGGKADAILGYMEGVTREMPRAIEAINRMVTALAAYRLERQRGASHENAVQYSKDAVNDTQFNYNPANAPPIFNHPLAKAALQFKRYGQGMYQLIGTQIGYAIRNQNPGDRAQAVKTLITLAATHTAIAGALGLPTEPFKYLLMASHALGLTKTSWSDIEDKIRKEAANVFGKTGGEVLSRGLPHLLNVDLSRVGLDTITSFGEPKGQKEADTKSWLFDTLAGPVVALGGDWIKGAIALGNGDFAKAAELTVPLKAASDSLRAYRQATEGKKSASGRQTMTPYNAYETGLRVAGFAPAREAETGALTSSYYRQADRQKEDRGALVNTWAQAKPTEKTKAMAAITQWNQKQPEAVRIKPKELTDKLKRDAKEASKGAYGIVPNKRDQHIFDEAKQVFNP